MKIALTPRGTFFSRSSLRDPDRLNVTKTELLLRENSSRVASLLKIKRLKRGKNLLYDVSIKFLRPVLRETKLILIKGQVERIKNTDAAALRRTSDKTRTTGNLA